jgi:hypothetical protein
MLDTIDQLIVHVGLPFITVAVAILGYAMYKDIA